MSETQPRTTGEEILAGLQKTIDVLKASNDELLALVATVVQSFLDDYDTDNDVPECPHCSEGYCRGHDEQTYHLRCGELVQQCECLSPYLALARRAADGVTDWAATAQDLISGDPQRVGQHLLDFGDGDGGRDLVFCAPCNTLAMAPHTCTTALACHNADHEHFPGDPVLPSCTGGR